MRWLGLDFWKAGGENWVVLGGGGNENWLEYVSLRKFKNE